MAIITTWVQGEVKVSAAKNGFCIEVTVPGNLIEAGYIRLTTDELIQHRDECSRLIVEAAQASAKAAKAEGETA